nr:hypothetical protein [Hymenobacter ruricola]
MFVKRFLLLLLLAMLLVPAIQAQLHFSKEAGLNGAFTLAPRPRLGWDSLQAGTYQPALEQYLTDHLGFRPYLVRLRNQLSFWLFRVARTPDVVVGRAGVLFQPGPVASYQGRDLLPAAEVRFRVRRLRAVQRALHRRGVELLFVLAPAKARFEPENLPAHLRPPAGTLTNYDQFTRALRADSVALLDFVPVFAHWKTTRPYPLFPRGGAHWSGYGATLAADTLLRRLEALGHLRFPEVRTVGPPRLVRALDSLRGTDNDLSWLLNLVEQPEATPLAYRQLAFAPPRPGQTRPSALLVGDSFTWGLMQFSPYVQREFADDTRFWYYNHAVHVPDSVYHDTGETAGRLELRQQLESRRFVLLLFTEHNLTENEFGFTDQVYHLYHPHTAPDRAAIDRLALQLRGRATWEAQTKNPDGAAQRARQQAHDLFDRQQLR